MRIGIRAEPVIALAAALTAILAPVRFSATEAPAPATAECTTCCNNPGARCVVCAASCIQVPDSYDNGGGKCVVNES